MNSIKHFLCAFALLASVDGVDAFPAIVTPIPVDHPVSLPVAQRTVGAWNSNVGKWGEQLVDGYLNLTNYQTIHVKSGDQGIDRIAIRRAKDGKILKVRFIEVKTTRGSFTLGETRVGKQASENWLRRCLNDMAKSPDPKASRLGKELAEHLASKTSTEIAEMTEIHQINTSNNTYRRLMADGKTEIGSNQIDDFLRTVAKRGRTPAHRAFGENGLKEYTRIVGTSRSAFLKEGEISSTVRKPIALSQSLNKGLSGMGVSQTQIRVLNKTGRSVVRIAGNISKAGERAVVRVLGRSGARALGKIAGPVAVVAFTAWEIKGCFDECAQLDEAFKRGEISQTCLVREKNKSVGRTTGSVVGGTGGVAAGAALGALIGAEVGFVGAIPGAIIGGIFGAFGGSVGGGKAGEAVADKMSPAEVAAKKVDYDERGRQVEQWFLSTSLPGDFIGQINP